MHCASEIKNHESEYLVLFFQVLFLAENLISVASLFYNHCPLRANTDQKDRF